MTLYEAATKHYLEMSLGELRLMHKNLRDTSITYNSLLYLDIIAYTENCTVSYLANALHVAKSSVTIKINELVNAGLVEKTQCARDKRVYYLHVKPEVAQQYKAYDRAFDYAVENMQQHFSPEDISLFCEMLTAFSEFYGKGIDNE